MSGPCALEIVQLSHSYGPRRALDRVSFTVEAGEIFGLLGPNGGGKTTLFKILSTLIPLTEGSARIFSRDIASEMHAVRELIGVVFQAPSLDKKLRVKENLVHQGHLYGLSGTDLENRIEQALQQLGLSDRSQDLVEKLSGGLQRRVEIAKALLHRPKLLLLDEPSTGLDPGARKDLWETLMRLRKEGTTVVLTTHLMEEAEKCGRLAILDHGSVVALDTPDALRNRIGGELVMIRSRDPVELSRAIHEKFGVESHVVDDTVRFEHAKGHEWISQLLSAFASKVDTVTVGKPTLEDVFIQLTGHRFWISGDLKP